MQLGEVAGEILIDVSFAGKVDEELFVLGVRELDQIKRRGIDGRALVIHRAGAINEQPERDRKIFMPEADNGLGHVVLINLEGALRE